jgi:hypothetical protein
MMLSKINPDGKFESYRLDQLEEAFRELEWEKKGIMKSNFKGQYRSDMSDEQILARMKENGRLDADDGLVFARQLEEIDPRRFEVLKKPLDMWKRLLPVKTFTPGTDRITYRVRDFTGKAELNASANITEMALADATADEAFNKVYAWNLGYYYTAQELRKAAVAGISLQTDKVMSVELGYKERIQEVMFTGFSQVGLEGLFNHTGVTNTQVSAPGTGTNRTWTTATEKTPSEIVADITGMTAEIATDTRGLYGNSNMVIALPIAQFRYLGDTRMESGTDTTIMSFILQNSQSNGIVRFEPIYEMTGIGTGSTDLCLAYPMDPTVVEAQIAENILWSPMEMKGRAFIFGSEMEYGGVVVRYPVAMTQRYGI